MWNELVAWLQEIRTAMLQGGKPLDLVAGESVIIEAVGDRYKSWQGYKTVEETRIGLSYAGLCSSVTVGSRILLADGAVCIEVTGVHLGSKLPQHSCFLLAVQHLSDSKHFF
jgi:pyruvate kinase